MTTILRLDFPAILRHALVPDPVHTPRFVRPQIENEVVAIGRVSAHLKTEDN